MALAHTITFTSSRDLRLADAGMCDCEVKPNDIYMLLPYEQLMLDVGWGRGVCLWGVVSNDDIYPCQGIRCVLMLGHCLQIVLSATLSLFSASINHTAQISLVGRAPVLLMPRCLTNVY